MMDILATMRDPNLFARWFRDKETWQAWEAFLRALFGLEMTPEQRSLFEACTGRSEAPTEPCQEAWLVVGRRGGTIHVAHLQGLADGGESNRLHLCASSLRVDSQPRCCVVIRT